VLQFTHIYDTPNRRSSPTMSEPVEPVVTKAIKATLDAKCSPPATAAVAKTFTDISKLGKGDRGQYLAALRTILGDEAVTDSDDVAHELTQAAAALAVTRKGRELAHVGA
jgi:hypothetical protein